MIRAARARLRDTPSEERALRPGDVPGTLLNLAFLNLSSDDEVLRSAAYNLIVELSQFFRYELAIPALKITCVSFHLYSLIILTRPAGLVIPGNSLSFIYGLSKSLAATAPHLTLEFLKEWTIGITKASLSQKSACLYYVAPWLANLELYSRPGREEGASAIKQVGEIVRGLISLTVVEQRVSCLSSDTGTNS
jgi:neurofibromin 1